MFAPESTQRIVKRACIPAPHLLRREPTLIPFRRRAQIREIELEHADAAPIPVVEHADEIPQEATAIERHRRAGGVERALPLGGGPHARQRVRTEPNPWLDAGYLAGCDPAVGPIR